MADMQAKMQNKVIADRRCDVTEVFGSLVRIKVTGPKTIPLQYTVETLEMLPLQLQR